MAMERSGDVEDGLCADFDKLSAFHLCGFGYYTRNVWRLCHVMTVFGCDVDIRRSMSI